MQTTEKLTTLREKLRDAGMDGYVVTTGDFHGSGDYPTICPGINHGRCLTFGRIAGIEAAGGTDDEIADYDLNMPVGGGIGRSTL